MAFSLKSAPALVLLAIGLVAVMETVTSMKDCRPHIVYILVDDMGWRDVSWNADDMYTPVMANLTKKGVLMHNKYMQAACSASRVALLTGMYPSKLGIQRNNYSQYHRWRNLTLDRGNKILPEYLKCLGYSNHMVGKWQMGFCNWELTPTRRGFDTYYGSFGGNSDHMLHTAKVGGYDMRDNLNVDLEANGTYSTTLYTDRAVKAIKDHKACNDVRPLFLYLAYEAPHIPLQVPDKYLQYCSGITDPERKIRCGMMAAVDEGIGKVMDTLKELEYDRNLLVVVTSDNGAPGQAAGSNWPLRGKKRSAYEGGIRVPSLVWSPNLIQGQPFKYKGLFHVTDWLPTLLRVAGAEDLTSMLPKSVDGIDQWKSLRNNEDSPRQKVVLDVHKDEGYGAVRIGNFKLVKDPGDDKGKCWGWFNPPPGYQGNLGKKTDCNEYQLYNINKDPGETNDIAADNPTIVNRLKKFLLKSMAEVADLPVVVNVTESFPDNNDGIWGPGWC